MIDLTLVVLSYKNVKLLSELLATLEKNAPGQYHVLVVSTGGYIEQKKAVCQMRHLSIAFMEAPNSPNLVVREVVAKATTPFVALLHDDVFFPPGNQELWSHLMWIAGHEGVLGCAPTANDVDGVESIFCLEAPTWVVAHYVRGCCVAFNREALASVIAPGDQLTWWDSVCIRAHDCGLDLVVDRRHYVHHYGGAGWQDRVVDFDKQILRWQELHWNELITNHGLRKVHDYWLRSGSLCNLRVALEGDGMDESTWWSTVNNYMPKAWIPKERTNGRPKWARGEREDGAAAVDGTEGTLEDGDDSGHGGSLVDNVDWGDLYRDSSETDE